MSSPPVQKDASGSSKENPCFNDENKNVLVEVSRSFWSKQITYPQFGTTKQRRLHELKYLMARIPSIEPKTLLDIGCGTGSTVTMLRELTDIETYYCLDISPGMLSSIDSNELRGSRVVKGVLDLAEGALTRTFDFPKADLTLALAVFQYVPDDVVLAVLDSIPSKHLIIRNACYSLSEGTKEIRTFSEKLESEYACLYRTCDDYVRLAISSKWDVVDMKRAFPDAIESEFGTKQWIMHLEKKQ